MAKDVRVSAVAPSNGSNSPAQRSLLDAELIPSILPRITSIVDVLERVGVESVGGGVTNTTTTEQPQPQQHQPSTSEPNTSAFNSHAIPSIALGASSDETSGGILDDFFASGSSAGGGGDGTASTIPRELTVRLVEESKELRAVYAECEKRIKEWDEGEWEMMREDETGEIEEVQRWLEAQREVLR